MKSLFFTFALLLTGASAFAASDITNPATDNTDLMTVVDALSIDDEICYSATVQIGVGAGPISVGASVQVSGCGETAAEAWSEFLDAMQHITEL